MKKFSLCCPCEVKEELIEVKGGYICKNTSCAHNQLSRAFPKFNAIPFIISEIRTDTVCHFDVKNIYIDRKFSKFVKLQKLITGVSPTTKINCSRFLREVKKSSRNPRILIVGGGSTGSGRR